MNKGTPLPLFKVGKRGLPPSLGNPPHPHPGSLATLQNQAPYIESSKNQLIIHAMTLKINDPPLTIVLLSATSTFSNLLMFFHDKPIIPLMDYMAHF